MIKSLLMSLTEILLQDGEKLLLKDDNGGVSVADLRKSIAIKYDFLQEKKAKSCLVFRADTSDFVSDFLACVYANVDIVLLPNAQKKTIERAKKTTDVIFSDFIKSTENKPRFTNNSERSYKSHNVNVILFTSGSTGQARSIARPLSYLLSEAETLEYLWGDDIEGAVVLSTVSHQHIYGLLFKVLWPLCYGHKIWRNTVPFEENLYFLIHRFSKTILISSPAFLTRLSGYSPHAKKLIYAFSSGGKLPLEKAQQVECILDAKCVRVYGSTETGGIAHQSGSTEVWTPFPRVTLRRVNEILEVSSPYCYQQPWFRTADRVRLTGDMRNKQQFFLLGRADDVVKIEEKRISLIEVENALCQYKPIKEAKVIVLPMQRKCLGAVLILHNENAEHKDIRSFYQQIRYFLADYFEAVTIPKYFRCILTFPENEQGKVDYNSLLELFGVSDDANDIS